MAMGLAIKWGGEGRFLLLPSSCFVALKIQREGPEEESTACSVLLDRIIHNPQAFWHCSFDVIQNHRVFEVGRDLWMLSGPTLNFHSTNSISSSQAGWGSGHPRHHLVPDLEVGNPAWSRGLEIFEVPPNTTILWVYDLWGPFQPKPSCSAMTF